MKYYFTFLMSDDDHKRCYHVEEAESYDAARERMIAKYGIKWAFQYSEEEWIVSKEQYDKIFAVDTGLAITGEKEICGIDHSLPEYHAGITQAELFNLREI